MTARGRGRGRGRGGLSSFWDRRPPTSSRQPGWRGNRALDAAAPRSRPAPNYNLLFPAAPGPPAARDLALPQRVRRHHPRGLQRRRGRGRAAAFCGRRGSTGGGPRLGPQCFLAAAAAPGFSVDQEPDRRGRVAGRPFGGRSAAFLRARPLWVWRTSALRALSSLQLGPCARRL